MLTLRIGLISSLFGLVAAGCNGCGDGSGAGPLPDAMPDAAPDAIDLDAGDGDAAADADAAPPSMCPVGACDLITNGCDGDLACYFLGPVGGGGAPSPMCAASGDGVQGEDCMEVEDCASGFHCDVPQDSTTGIGTCRHYCCGPGDTANCPADSLCLIEFIFENTGTGAFLCEGCADCDLVGQDDCGPGEGCYIGSSDGCKLCIAPATPVPLAEGVTCVPQNDCAPGLGCFNVAPMGSPEDTRCVKFCTIGGDDCGDMQTCSAIEGFTDVGVCLPPAVP